jgi:hypothetical protein
MKKYLVLLLLLIAIPCWGEDFFVGETATGTADGKSWANQWALSDVSGATTKWNAIKTSGYIGPGDTIYIDGGAAGITYTTQIRTRAAGSSGNVISWKPGSDSPDPTNHDGNVTITITSCSAATSTYPIYIGHNYSVVDGGVDKKIIVRDSCTNVAAPAVIIGNLQGVKVTRLQVTDNGIGKAGTGIQIYQHGVDVAGAVEVSYNTLTGNSIYGIKADPGTARTTFGRLLIHHNTISGIYEDGIYCGTTGCDIYNNTLTEISTNKTTQHPDPINCANSYCRAYNNYLYNLEQHDKVTNSYIYLGLYNSPSGYLKSFTYEHSESFPLESYDANVTPTHTTGSATDYDSANLAVGDAVGANTILFTESITSANLNVTGYDYITISLWSSVNLAAGDLQLLVDDTANCASPLRSLDIPATTANTWTRHNILLGGTSDLTAIISLGVKQIVDKGAFTIKVGGIAVKERVANWSNIYVYNNLIVETNNVTGSQANGIYITQTYSSDSVSNIGIWNNTIIGTSAYGLSFYDATGSGNLSNVSIENNIIRNCGQLTTAAVIFGASPSTYSSHGGSGLVFDYNSISGTNTAGPKVYFKGTAYATLAALQAATDIQDHGLDTDPTLNSDYKATNESSNIVGAGVTQTYFTVDKDGTTRSGSWDIGAYEYTGTPTDTTAPTLSSLTPSGNVDYATTKQLSVTTNENATCRYHASSTTWADMTEMSSTGGTTHTQTVNVSVGANSFKVKCQDSIPNESDAGTWSFTVAAAPVSQWVVTTSYAGTGTGTTDPAEGTRLVNDGTTDTTTQTPGANSTFTGWSGTCGCTGTGACAPSITASCTKIATWTADTSYTLSVTAGEGAGVIVSDTGYISCGSGNVICEDSFYSGTVVLTGTCAEGFYNGQWSGDGTGTTTRSFTMSSDQSVGFSCEWAGAKISSGSMGEGSIQ